MGGLLVFPTHAQRARMNGPPGLWGCADEGIPQGLKPILWRAMRPEAEASGYLEANVTATASATANANTVVLPLRLRSGSRMTKFVGVQA